MEFRKLIKYLGNIDGWENKEFIVFFKKGENYIGKIDIDEKDLLLDIIVLNRTMSGWYEGIEHIPIRNVKDIKLYECD